MKYDILLSIICVCMKSYGLGNVISVYKPQFHFSKILGFLKPKERSLQELRDGIAKFYDESSQVW
jgi:hypothetical protein